MINVTLEVQTIGKSRPINQIKKCDRLFQSIFQISCKWINAHLTYKLNELGKKKKYLVQFSYTIFAYPDLY